MWGAVAGAALGGLAGAQGSSSSQSSVSGIRVAPETELEKQATKSLQGGLGGFESIVNAGPGTQAATDAMGSNKSLQDMLKSFAGGGFMPGQADFDTANKYASDVFKPQQVMQQQQFQSQQQQAQRLAAQLNRPVNDPIIQAKLAQEQMRQADVLGAQQSAYGAQFAQQLPMQRLGFTQQLADVNNNLASQAMSNRQALLSLGSTLREQDRSYRINTGERYGTQTQSSGGGLAGAINGAIGGAGAGMAVQSMLGKFGGAAAPAAAGPTSSMDEFSALATQRAVGNQSQSMLSAGGGMGIAAPASPYASQATSYGVPSFLNPATGYGQQGSGTLTGGNFNPVQSWMQQFGSK